ncbi:hypothetical protein HPB48_000679 [Haemaphysalis longicornis]|uniref:Uncharacterized protein n=1 Tax=Haemaphysalis longicornis TaxID=44386 RepID=A0A9J6FNC8_HAELO|nr:hypothetical protein HPB48_000679 [Haemaphysalis longicornis]
MVRNELLELSQEINTPRIVYRIDTLPPTYGREEVVLVPPFYCKFKPTERVWSQLKGHFARRNRVTMNLKRFCQKHSRL